MLQFTEVSKKRKKDDTCYFQEAGEQRFKRIPGLVFQKQI